MVLKYWRSMKVPKELKATGRMSAWKVLTQSSLLISRNSGITSTTCGIISVDR